MNKRGVIGLGLLLAAAILGAVWQIGRALTLDASFRRSDVVQQFDKECAAAVRPLLPAFGVVSYQERGSSATVPESPTTYYLTQYSLAPLVVVIDGEEPVVVDGVPQLTVTSPTTERAVTQTDASDRTVGSERIGAGLVLGVLSLGPYLALGGFLACWAWRLVPAPHGLRWLRLFLAVPLGIGLSSAAFFTWAVFTNPARPGLGIAETLGIAALAAVLFLTRPPATEETSRPVASVGSGDGWVRWTFIFVAACAFAAILLHLWRSPHGDWDAWAIWNLRARFLHRGGEHWTATFSARIGWSHPDYPVLLPGAVARGWYYAGNESTLVPQLIAGLFTVSAAGLLTSAVCVLRGPIQGCLAGLVLLSTGQFLNVGTAQYADVPLGCFILASAVLFEFHDRYGGADRRLLILAGLLAGMAAWTKNEGCLFILATLLARCTTGLRWKELSAIAVGLLPFLSLLVYFKFWIAPVNDLVGGQGWSETTKRLVDPVRYGLVVGYFVQNLMLLGPGAVGVLGVYGWCMGRTQGPAGRLTTCHSCRVLGMMLAGYAVVYLLTPHNLAWHLDTSLPRLFVQLWPLALLAFFLIVEAPAGCAGSTWTRERDETQGWARNAKQT